MEQWGCLFSVHDITLLLLRCHGQWTQWTSRKKIQRCKWNTSFCMYYIFTSKTNKGKSLCVSLISHVFFQKIRQTLLCVSVSSKSVCKNNLFAIDFCYAFGDFETFLANVEFDRYSKSPCQSLKKTSVTTFISSFI